MTVPLLSSAFVTGELAPSLYGRVDIDRQRIAGSTVRNMIIDYRGAALSRAGSQFAGFSKQTGRRFPPRLITFQFSISQGLALEFGNEYMRVLSDGGLVTETPVAIGGVTQASPAVMTFGASGAQTAVPVNTNVTFSYAPGDDITLAGGTSLTEAVLNVDSSELHSIISNSKGTGYAPGDTITLGGGTPFTAAILTVNTIAAVAASGFIAFTANPTDGATITLNGVAWTFKTVAVGAAQTTIQPTLAGTLAQLASDLNASVNASLTVATYSSNSTVLLINYDTTGVGGNAYTLVAGAGSNGTVSAATLTGGTATGIATFTITNAGIYTALPGGGTMTQSASGGGGTGATFQTAVFAPHAVSIINPGAYITLPANPVGQDTTTGVGVGAQFIMTWGAVSPFANGDDVFISGVQGMTELNGNTYTLAAVTPTTAILIDPYGQPVDSTGFHAYTGGGTAARIYTLPTIYNEEDLPYLKFVQSADVMTLCCVNQVTGTEYPPQDLSRFSNTNWSFSGVVAVDSVSPPASTAATITASGTTFYQYVVTAISPVDGSESIASAIAAIEGVTISATAGQVNISWSPVDGVSEYNIYKALPSLGSPVPPGSLFGYIGSAYGVQFNDTNIVPAFVQVPPRHINPFSRGAIIGMNIISGGTGYTTASAAITSLTGSGAIVDVIVQNGAVVAVVIEDAGANYQDGDTVVINGTGTGATASLVVGAQTGTYPSVPSYFQQRRFYANSENQPDTYWASQIGAYTNFDARIPPVDNDALSGSPWGVQVNGIQFMVQTAAGLVLFNGLSAWLLNGTGGFATNSGPITPSSQDANPQPFTGCSPTVPPIKINNEILYVTAIASLYYDLPYQLNLSEPVDLTRYSTHLFKNHTVIEHAWCEQPNKVLWSVRDDGIMLSLTFLKDEQIAGWGRHDTNGLFCSVCSVIEPPINALYMATKRFIGNNEAYMLERMDDRLWQQVEDAWCVDCALELPRPTPSANLSADSASGLGSITGVTNLIGGSGYSAGTQVVVFDDNEGPGAGATGSVTVDVNGAITAVNILTPGAAYLYPKVQFQDPANTGTGASADAVLSNAAIFTASAAVFSAGNIGDVIRVGNGVATIVSFTDTQHVGVEITTPITALRPNSGGIVLQQPAGSWSMTNPTMLVSGLGHLAGAEVTGLADGVVIAPQIVSAAGTIELAEPASAIVIGLAYTAQLQSVYVDAGNPTVQGARKKIGGVNILVEASRDVMTGSNQIDGSALNPPQIAPEWSNLDGTTNLLPRPYNSPTVPLYTGYVRATVQGGYKKPGQVAVQQDLPLPLNVLALVGEMTAGDPPEEEKAA